MCGIFGAMSSFLSDAEKKMVFGLGLANTLRGTDSSGMATYEPGKKKFFLHTSMYIAPEMMLSFYNYSNKGRSPQDMFLSNKEKVSALIGHCRAATVGVINHKTAHPFYVGDLIGVHNGTIKGIVPSNLTDTEKDTKLGSDSYHVYKYLSEHTPEEAYQKLDPMGAFALVWFDTRDKTINFMRNGERPLFHTGDSTLYFSSTKEDLEYIGWKNNIKVTPSLFEVGQHYKCTIGDNFTKVIKQKVKKETFVSKYSSGIFGSYPWEDTEEKPVSNVIPLVSTSVPVVQPEVSDPTHHKFEDLRIIPIASLKKWITDCTCTNCNSTLSFDKKMTWLKYESSTNRTNMDYISNSVMPLCPVCEADEQVLTTFKSYGDVITSTPWKSTLPV